VFLRIAHVLAKHASIREDRPRQAAVVTLVFTYMSNDRSHRRWRCENKLQWRAFSRRPEFESTALFGIVCQGAFHPYGAARFRSSMERNAAL